MGISSRQSFDTAQDRAQGTTWHVRPDGGSPEQCTGLVDAPYPGSGTAQSCAWDHPFRALPPGGPPRIAGGDTLIIGADSYMMGATAQQEGLRPELTRTLTAQAGLELAQGGRGSARRARRLLGQVLWLFRELDMAGEARRARERLRSLPRQPGARAPAPLPAGLTPREVEVLRLVATGKTNRQIAEELFLRWC